MWAIAAGVLCAVAGILLFLEQRWAEDVNLAFFHFVDEDFAGHLD